MQSFVCYIVSAFVLVMGIVSTYGESPPESIRHPEVMDFFSKNFPPKANSRYSVGEQEAVPLNSYQFMSVPGQFKYQYGFNFNEPSNSQQQQDESESYPQAVINTIFAGASDTDSDSWEPSHVSVQNSRPFSLKNNVQIIHDPQPIPLQQEQPKNEYKEYNDYPPTRVVSKPKYRVKEPYKMHSHDSGKPWKYERPQNVKYSTLPETQKKRHSQYPVGYKPIPSYKKRIYPVETNTPRIIYSGGLTRPKRRPEMLAYHSGNRVVYVNRKQYEAPKYPMNSKVEYKQPLVVRLNKKNYPKGFQLRPNPIFSVRSTPPSFHTGENYPTTSTENSFNANQDLFITTNYTQSFSDEVRGESSESQQQYNRLSPNESQQYRRESPRTESSNESQHYRRDSSHESPQYSRDSSHESPQYSRDSSHESPQYSRVSSHEYAGQHRVPPNHKRHSQRVKKEEEKQEQKQTSH